MMKQGTLFIGLLAIGLSGCVTIGGKMPVPTALLTLTPQMIASADNARVAGGEALLNIAAPLTPQALNVTRIPVYDGSAQITYIKGATWAEVPATLFKALLTEVVAAKTGRVIVDPRQTPVAAGATLSGRLIHFGVDAPSGKAVVTYDALLAHAGSKALASRRFQAKVDVGVIEGSAAGRALNTAANDIAGEVAEWVKTN
jgi:cholesterol transport system auxiliary component